MTDLRKAAEMALEALERCEYGVISNGRLKNSIEALRQALAQPEQELTEAHYKPRYNPTINAFDTAPPKREWVGLTDEEIGWLWHNSPPNSHEYARAIEAKLKEKNT